MAIWQFSLRPIDRQEKAQLSSQAFAELPTRLGPAQTSALVAQLSCLLPRVTPTPSWKGRGVYWGDDKATDMTAGIEAGALVDLLVRIDARDIPKGFLSGLIKIAQAHNWLFALSDGRLIEPTALMIEKAFVGSAED